MATRQPAVGRILSLYGGACLLRHAAQTARARGILLGVSLVLVLYAAVVAGLPTKCRTYPVGAQGCWSWQVYHRLLDVRVEGPILLVVTPKDLRRPGWSTIYDDHWELAANRHIAWGGFRFDLWRDYSGGSIRSQFMPAPMSIPVRQRIIVRVPLWMIFVPLGLYPAIRLRFYWRRRQRRKHGLCLSCGYNLTGLIEPRCPECAMPIAAASGWWTS